MGRIVQGKQWTWQLGDQPIGSGDAGEVYAVTCLDKPSLNGVLKKPARIATGGTIQRQAGQIAREGRALAALDGLPEGKAHPPKLLDEAPGYTEGTAQYFIVSQNASGMDLAAMLSETRQNGNPFPHRVIISVLDALFDLFSRAHKTGVLWNDVKLDHIFWNNETGKITIIDWGNARFLDKDDSTTAPAGERWEDYRQMIHTLGGFLRQTAPELYQDLGWEAFLSSEMNSPVISVLARRIAYQQQVMALKVMEYQALIRVVLSIDPDLEGLEEIRTYQKILTQIGAPWESQAVLDYASSLVGERIASGETTAAIKATALLWEMLPEGLDLSWHLVREVFRYPDILQSPLLPDLVQQILTKQWSKTLWILIRIGKDSNAPAWWDRVIPVVRQKALGLATPPPYQICQSLLTWCQQHGENKQRNAALKEILSNWRRKGLLHNASPFEYEVLDVLEENSDIPLRIRTELKKSFAAGKEGIREILQTWVMLDWDAFPKAFRQVAGWDPDRWGLVQLADDVTLFESWLAKLAEGPGESQNPLTFIQEMEKDRPRVEKTLGKPGWLKAMESMLETLLSEQSIQNVYPEIQTWCPWLLSVGSLDATGWTDPQETETTAETLENFLQHLKSWGDVEGAVDQVRLKAPNKFPACQSLANRFDQLFLLSGQMETQSSGKMTAHPVLAKAWDVLETLSQWRNAVMTGDMERAHHILDEVPAPEWRLWQCARERTLYWQQVRMPLLKSISLLQPETNNGEKIPADDRPLLTTKDHLEKATQNFARIYKHGLHLRLIETVEEDIESMRKSFMCWRQAMEKGENRIDTVLYHCHLALIRQISRRFARLSEHIRKVRLSFTILTTLQGTVAVQLSEGGKVMAHLAAVESLIIPQTGDQPLQHWKAAFDALLQTENVSVSTTNSQRLEPNHPLYTWIAQLRR